jgi:hypothetical protein
MSFFAGLMQGLRGAPAAPVAPLGLWLPSTTPTRQSLSPAKPDRPPVNLSAALTVVPNDKPVRLFSEESEQLILNVMRRTGQAFDTKSLVAHVCELAGKSTKTFLLLFYF